MLLQLGFDLVNNVSKKIIEESKNKPLGIEIGSTGASGDKTKSGDDIVEKVIIASLEILSKKEPEKKIILISEETGLMEFGNKESRDGYFFVLDPLDGSNNLRPRKTPAPCVTTSLAIGELSRLKNNNNFDAIEMGIVKEIFNDRIYRATKNSQSEVNNFGKIQTSPNENLEKSIIGIDLDLQGEKLEKIEKKLFPLLTMKQCQRRLGSSIFDFMKVACGEYDAFVSLGGRMKFYDLAAAKLIVEKAGGIFEYATSDESECIIKKIIETKDINLLKSITYKVIASGNKTIHNKIKESLGGKF